MWKGECFLKKASYRKKVVLLIDNISRAQNRIAIEAAHALLYKNPSLKIILGITEDGAMPDSSTLTPPLFGEMHIIEMAKKYEKQISVQAGKEIVRISNGIPSYVRMIFQTNITGLYTHRRTALLRCPPPASSCLSPLRRKENRHPALWPGAFSYARRVYPSGLSCCASGAGVSWASGCPSSNSSGSRRSSMLQPKTWATL